MTHRGPPTELFRPALALAVAVALLGGCAEIHRGTEAVGRLGGAPAAAADAAPGRPDVKTVRPRGAPRPPAEEADAADAPRPAALASAVPAPRDIFDFHPAGARPDAWRQPFVIDTSDGPLAAEVRRSSAQLREFLADQKAGRKDAGAAGARRCGEDALAAGRPGCPPGRAATARQDAAP